MGLLMVIDPGLSIDTISHHFVIVYLKIHAKHNINICSSVENILVRKQKATIGFLTGITVRLRSKM